MRRAEPRHVLYLAWAPFFSGAERALLLTLRALDPDRYHPVVIAGTDGEFAAQVAASGIECHVASLEQLDRARPWRGLAAIAGVLRRSLQHRISLIHSNDMPSFKPGGYAARVLGVPTVSHVRFPSPLEGYEWFFRPGFDRALFVSQWLMHDAIDTAPQVFDGRSDVLYDWVEPQPIWSDAERAAVRRELGISDSEAAVGFAGQIAEIKGIWDLIEAARILCTRPRPPVFVIVGDDLKTGGKTRQAMQQRVDELGMTPHFRFLGFRADAPRLVQAFDVVTVPSHVEPLGNATLEAMAAGRPVVGSRVGGIPEMIVEGETGLLIPPSNPAELATGIARLLDDPAMRCRMGTAGRSRSHTVFGAAEHARQLQACYDRILN